MAAALTDTHCHLDRCDDPAATVERMHGAGVDRVVAVTLLPSDYERVAGELAGLDGVEIALGFHPVAVAGRIPWIGEIDVERELTIFLEHAGAASFIGEIGIDLTEMGAAKADDQARVLDTILAATADKPMTLHTTGAVSEGVAHLRAAGVGRAILHAFSGDRQQLDDALDAGCFISVSPVMTEDPARATLIDAIPRERVVVETDSPFQSIRERPLEPADAAMVRDHLAARWDCSPAQAVEILAANMARLRR